MCVFLSSVVSNLYFVNDILFYIRSSFMLPILSPPYISYLFVSFHHPPFNLLTLLPFASPPFPSSLPSLFPHLSCSITINAASARKITRPRLIAWKCYIWNSSKSELLLPFSHPSLSVSLSPLTFFLYPPLPCMPSSSLYLLSISALYLSACPFPLFSPSW